MNKYVVKIEFNLVVSGKGQIDVKLRDVAVSSSQAGTASGNAVSKGHGYTITSLEGCQSAVEVVPLGITVVEVPAGNNEEMKSSGE